MRCGIKLFCIALLVVSGTLCFAEQVDIEETELKSTIFTPIISHFAKENGGNSSISERLSAAIVQMEVDRKNQFTRNDIDQLIKNGTFKNIVNDEKSIKCMDMIKEGSNDDTPLDFTTRHLKVWNLKMATCRAYATFVLIAFEFNYMININLHRNLDSYNFKDARIVSTIEPSDHSIVLVEGKSGTMFVIDPWARKIIRLDSNFTKLSAMLSSKLSDDDNKKLNSLYSNPYYDAYYVDARTEWKVNNPGSDKITNLVFTCDTHMRDFYTALKGSFSPWTKNYSDLFPRCGNPLE
jgi:hypothetical protein